MNVGVRETDATEQREAAEPPRTSTVRADLLWIVVLGALALAYFLLLIAFGTSYFFAVPGAARVSDVEVWGTAALLLLQVVFVPLRRRRPTAMFAAMVVILLAAEVVAGDRSLAINLTLLFAVWNLTYRRPPRVWLPAVISAIAADIVLQIAMFAGYGAVPLSAVFVVVIRTGISFGIAIPAGLFVRSQQRSAELALAVSRSQEREYAARVDVAIANERARMARELHDVAAYHLSGIMLQASAAREVLPEDPTLAAELVDSVRSESELTIRSLRDVIGVLRGAGADGTTAPMPRLPDLLAEWTSSNSPVDVTIEGDLDDLPPATALAAYRIVQESLTNARTHSPGARVTVAIARQTRWLTLSIRNDAPTSSSAGGSGGGFGLVGMRERVSILGGELTANATDGGGWVTRAVMPTEAPL